MYVQVLRIASSSDTASQTHSTNTLCPAPSAAALRTLS